MTPGIHPAVGVEDALELAECLDQLRAEYFWQQFGARAAVAVLAGQRAAELADQIGDTHHRGLELRDARGAEKVKVDPAMDASVAEMPVKGCRFQMMRVEQGGEPAQEAAEFFRRHGSVLGARPSARTPRDDGTGAEAGFAQFPHRPLLAVIDEQLTGRANRLAAGALAPTPPRGRAPRRRCRRRTRPSDIRRRPEASAPPRTRPL